MIKNSVFRTRIRTHSLYFGLITAILFGVVIAAVLYLGVRALANYGIQNIYLDEERVVEREEAYIKSLQKYVDTRALTSEDTDQIVKWTQENRYVYLLIYKADELIFSSDILEEEKAPTDESGEGEQGSTPSNDRENMIPGIDGILTSPDREALLAQAEANGLKEIEMSDGTLLASVADFSEYLYYDLGNIMALSVGIVALALILIYYFSRIIKRVKRLENDVSIVTNSDMTHSISSDGRDEISVLSRNVENMRKSILENLEREREARDANTELITSMSHDIRTPLTVLLGYIDMMKNHGSIDGELESYIAASENTALRLKQLSDDMFKYSLAFGTEDMGIAIEEYDAKTLFEQLLLEHIVLLRERGYEVSFDMAEHILDEGTTVLTDAPNLMRIVDNIFSNLTKYADPDYPIIISSKTDRELFVVECRNRIRKDLSEAESNGVGLKTCVRLGRLIAKSFRYYTEGDEFVVRLELNVRKPK